MPKYQVIALKILATLALAGLLLLAGGFFAVKLGLTNVAGEEDADSGEYAKALAPAGSGRQIIQPAATSSATGTAALSPDAYGSPEPMAWCRIKAAAVFNDYNAAIIFHAYDKTHSPQLLDRQLLAMKLRLPDRALFDDLQNRCLLDSGPTSSAELLAAAFSQPENANLFVWQNDQRWQTIEAAIRKDQATIDKVSLQTGIPARLLASVLIVEQVRLYYTQRELYEKFFAPLKILANANKMAWGIMSIKEKTAIQTEDHLNDPASPFYPGPQYEKLLDFPAAADRDKERYRRLTDEHDHYYSYLYGALILKQLASQWSKAGYDIADRPEILATLFNIGFDHSRPKANPSVGGSTIMIGADKYFFGSLAYEFYYSGSLSDEFPWQ